LTALGLSEKVFKITVADSVIRVALTFFTVQFWGINGILFVMYISNLFTPICAYICLSNKVRTDIKMNDVFIPFINLYISLNLYKKFYTKNFPLMFEFLKGVIIIFLIYISLFTIIVLCKLMYKKIKT
jgi:hypothetical protein